MLQNISYQMNYLLIILSAGIAVSSVVYLIGMLFNMVESDARRYMDKPPALAMPIWPLVAFFKFFIGRYIPIKLEERLNQKLQNHGASFMLTGQEYFSLCLVLSSLIVLIALPLTFSDGSVAMLLLFASLGLVIPEVWLKELKRKRYQEIIKSLPIYLDYLSMCVDAGLNFSGALKQAVEKGPRGAMRDEFRMVLRDISSGQTLAESLNKLKARIDLRDVAIFVNAVIQAERTGASMRETLMIQAEQRLDERFQKAEKMAMEAPVKLIIPLVIFIFPLTFVILLFPVVIKFIEQGTL